jgi:16S rRNA (cytosine967-C5)-methyltransferase
LTEVQRRLLDRAVALTKPGGRIVYCVCSLEPEEGEQQIEALLAREPGLRRIPVEAGEIENAPFVNADGDLRTLPSHWDASHWNDSDPRMGGLDGFYAARLQRQ